MRPIAFDPINIALDEVTAPPTRFAVSDYMMSGVYFLYKGEELRYIGQSDNVISRVAAHRSAGRDFDTFSIFRCGKEWLLPLEAAFIRKFQPVENRAHTRSDIHTASDAFVEVVPPQPLPGSTPAKMKEWLRVLEAADYMGLSKSTLDKMRMTREGPPFSKLGRAVVYRRSDIDAWLRERSQASTWDSGWHVA